MTEQKPSYNKEDKQFKLMAEKLKEFILSDEEFHKYLKTYCFFYREFSPFDDYVLIEWLDDEEKWVIRRHLRYNDKLNYIKVKKNQFMLKLHLKKYNWGSLFLELEKRFIKELKKTMTNKELDDYIDNHYEDYSKARNHFIAKHKEETIENWFKINENTMRDYYQKARTKLYQRYQIYY